MRPCRSIPTVRDVDPEELDRELNEYQRHLTELRERAERELAASGEDEAVQASKDKGGSGTLNDV